MFVTINNISYVANVNDDIDFNASLGDPNSTCDFTLDDPNQSITLKTKMPVVVWDENALPVGGLPTIPSMNFLQQAYNFNNAPWAKGGSLSGLIVVSSHFLFDMTFNNSTNGGQAYFTQTTLMGHIQPGVKYMLAVYVTGANTISNIQYFFSIDWLNASGSIISTVSTQGTPALGSNHLNITGVAPAGAVQATIKMGGQTTSGTNSGKITISTPQFEPCWFEAQGITYPTYDCNFDQVNSVQLPDGTTSRACRIFAGYIEDLTRDYDGTQRTYTVKCASASKLLENLGTISRSYSATYDTGILTDIFTNVTPFSTYLSIGQQNKFAPTSTIIQGSLIDSRSYANNTLREVINGLDDTSGSQHFVDPYYFLWYVPPSFSAQVLQLSDNPDNVVSFPYFDFSIEDDDTNPGNSILITGTKQNSTAITETFSGNGSQKVFGLSEPPYNVQSVTIGGTSQKTGVDGVQVLGTGGYVALVNKQAQTLTFQTAPVSGTNNVSITYTFEDPVVSQVISADSIAAAGRPFVRTVNDTSLTSTTTAKNRGLAELSKYAYARQILTLSGLNIYAPVGSLILFTCQPEGMVKKPFTIQTVESQLEGAGIYTWRYTCGVYSPTLIDHIRNTQKAVARPTVTSNVPTVINIDVAISDSFHFSDSITATIAASGPYTYGSAKYGFANYS